MMLDDLTTITAIASGRGLSLDPGYLAFLSQIKASNKALFIFNDFEWYPYGTADLLRTIRIGHGPPMPQALEAKAHAEFLGTLEARGGFLPPRNPQDSAVDFDLLRRSFTFGCHENGDPVFVDATSHAVYVFWHDGADIEPLAKNLMEFLEGSIAT